MFDKDTGYFYFVVMSDTTMASMRGKVLEDNEIEQVAVLQLGKDINEFESHSRSLSYLHLHGPKGVQVLNMRTLEIVDTYN